MSKIKVYILNDTNGYHAGCDAVMWSVRKILEDHEITGTCGCHDYGVKEDMIKNCDLVVVNGEGSMHHNQKTEQHLVANMKYAKSIGKKVFLINSVFQHEGEYEKDLFKELDFISVREPLSKYAFDDMGIDVDMFPDLCLNYYLENSNGVSSNNIRGIVKGDVHPDRGHHWFNDLPYESVFLNDRFENVVKTLSNKELYVTGQHHGIYAAILAKTPFLPISSNTHKIQSLIHWSGVSIPLITGSSNIKKYKEVFTGTEVSERLSSFLLNLPRLTKEKINEIIKREFTE